MAEYKLSYTASDIDRRLGLVDDLNNRIDDIDLSNYITKDEMPDIDVDEIVSRRPNFNTNQFEWSGYDDKSKWVDNSRVNNGVIVNADNRCLTPFINTTPNTNLYFDCPFGFNIVLYDIDYNYITHKAGQTFKTTNETAFIRFEVCKYDKFNAEITFDFDTVYERFVNEAVFCLMSLYTLDENVEIPNVPTKVSQFENDAGYITEDNLPEDIITDDKFKTQAENEEPTCGEELASADGWTADGWTGDFVNGFTHTTGNTNSLIFTMPEDTAQNTYRISFRCSEKITVESLMAKCGGSDLFDLYGQPYNPITIGIVSVENGNLEFVPASTFKGTITDISIKRVTGFNTTKQIITDSTGEISCEMRTTKSSLDNVFIGKHSGENNISGVGCAAVGSSALQNNTSGFWNVGVGLNALRDNTVGSRNVGIGYIALAENITGTRNIAIGTFALNHNKTGNKNIAIGADSLDKNESGSQNVAIGLQTLYSNVSGNFNTAVGVGSLGNSTSDNNTAVGYHALDKCTTGNTNIALGYCAGAGITTGSNNFALGANTLYKMKTGSNNIAIGVQAGRGQGTTAGFKHGIFIGANTGYALCDNADYNILIGCNAGKAITTGIYNIVLGDNIETPTPTTSHWVNIGGLYEGSRNTADKYAKINGGLQLSDIPTSDPAIAGRVWNDNGTLKVSAG